MKQQLQTVMKQDLTWLKSFTAPQEVNFSAVAKVQPSVQLIRLDEINEEQHQVYRQALVNVYASLDPEEQVRMLYVLEGSESGVNLYFGVVTESSDLQHEAYKNLRGALEGQLPGINFGGNVDESVKQELLSSMQQARYQGVLLGTPTGQGEENGQDKNNYQDIDRLVRALQSTGRVDSQSSSRWHLTVLTQPLTRQTIDQQLESAYQLSSKISALIRTSVQTGGNTSRQKSTSMGTSESYGVNKNTGKNWSKNEGASETKNQGQSSSLSQSSSINNSTSENHSINKSESRGTNTSTGKNWSKNVGESLSESQGKSFSVSESKNYSGSTSQSLKNNSKTKGTDIGSSHSTGGNTGTSQTKNSGVSEGGSTGEGKSYNTSTTSGSSSSITKGETTGFSHTAGETTGTSQSKNVGTSEGGSTGEGQSYNRSTTENDSLSDTTGSSINISQELANKQAQHLADYLDKQLIPRLQKGLTKGLFNTAVYFSASDRSTYKRMKNTLRATLQGCESTMSPLVPYDIPEQAKGQMLNFPKADGRYFGDDLIFRSLYLDDSQFLGSLLTGDELAMVASLPQQELQGVRRRKTVDFIVDLPDVNAEETLDLGMVIDRGRSYQNNRVCLSRKDLNKHVFVTGVTGAGKTTTCLNLLLESNMPFLVIEPAKTEYRELADTLGDAVQYYRPNGDDYQSLRINPFALVRKEQRIKSHAGFLKNVFAAVFPMEASMPAMVEAAILAAYEDKGWDLDENEFLLADDPFQPEANAWPTLGDMLVQLDKIIPTYGLGKEFEEKYRGSLVSRIRSLVDGTLGRVLDVQQSIDFHSLLENRVVIELEELQDSNEKALMMALLLGAINETMRAKHAVNPNFRQLTLVEEAHRLLSRPEAGDKTAALAVEAFADMLAEVRKYGTGMIIADQIPAKLIPDVIKNTHTKIVHRLFAEDDRRAMGEAMMMDDEQRKFLPNLGTGEAVVFCGGWHGPVHAGIRNDRAQTDNPAKLDLQHHYIQQLWQQRQRYYPQFSQLSWLSQNEQDAAKFASFVRSTRQAQNQLLHALDKKRKSDERRQTAYLRLRKWLLEWQPVAQQKQEIYQQWQEKQSEQWPDDLLQAGWVALLLDANPKLHADVKQPMPLNVEGERETILLATENLFQRVSEYESVEKCLGQVRKDTSPDLQNHLNHLKSFKML